jgi:hypothetical protein
MFSLLPLGTDMNSSLQIQAAVQEVASALLALENPFLPVKMREKVSKLFIMFIIFFCSRVSSGTFG